jgi:copper chaperone
MKNVELKIPDMQSAHCQARVNGAIKDIDGVKIEKLEAGKLFFSFESDEVKEVLVKAIEMAGYKVGDDSEKASNCSTSCCAS